MKRIFVALSIASVALAADAQDWKGLGRIFGKVMDVDGKPVVGASVKLDCPGRGGTTVVTDKKGTWAVPNIVACTWNVDVNAEGFQTKSISVPMPSESARMLPVSITVEKRQGPPPELVEALKKGDDAFKAQQWADARTAYEKVAQLRPDLAPQLYPRLARAYAAENNTEKALEYLQKSIDADPSNQDMKFIAANAAMESGMADKAMLFLGSIDDTKVLNGDGYYDAAINFLRKQDSNNAVTYFTKAIAKDPKIVEAYYYRGLAYVQLGKLAEAKTDMQKVIELDPAGPNGEKAKKALEGLPK